MTFEGVKDGVLTVSMPAPESFLDNDGVHVHSGLTTLFLDTIMGACAIGELKEFSPIATIKLNCNHLSKIKIGDHVSCHARQTGLAKGIAYISAEVISQPDNRLIANAIGTFMIGTASKPLKVKS